MIQCMAEVTFIYSISWRTVTPTDTMNLHVVLIFLNILSQGLAAISGETNNHQQIISSAILSNPNAKHSSAGHVDLSTKYSSSISDPESNSSRIEHRIITSLPASAENPIQAVTLGKMLSTPLISSWTIIRAKRNDDQGQNDGPRDGKSRLHPAEQNSGPKDVKPRLEPLTSYLPIIQTERYEDQLTVGQNDGNKDGKSKLQPREHNERPRDGKSGLEPSGGQDGGPGNGKSRLERPGQNDGPRDGKSRLEPLEGKTDGPGDGKSRLEPLEGNNDYPKDKKSNLQPLDSYSPTIQTEHYGNQPVEQNNGPRDETSSIPPTPSSDEPSWLADGSSTTTAKPQRTLNYGLNVDLSLNTSNFQEVRVDAPLPHKNKIKMHVSPDSQVDHLNIMAAEPIEGPNVHSNYQTQLDLDILRSNIHTLNVKLRKNQS